MSLVACVGTLDTTGDGDGDTSGTGTGGGGGGASEAKRLFNNNVYPVLKSKCIACHAAAGPVGNLSGFVTAEVTTAHETILGFTSVVGSYAPTAAPVLLKVTSTGSHQGQMYAPEEVTKITDWLNQEVIEQSGGSGSGSGSGSGTGTGTGTETPAQASQRVLAQWSSCMTKPNFDAANMANAWGNMTANNNQRCSNCHASGDGGFIATVDSQLFFDVVSSNKYYMLQYFNVKLDLANLANSAIEINTKSFTGVSNGQDPHREHPRFNALTNNGMTALKNFYDTTKAALTAAGTTGCGASKLTN
jgi:mono/diheme cytochrome c family protein